MKTKTKKTTAPTPRAARPAGKTKKCRAAQVGAKSCLCPQCLADLGRAPKQPHA